MKLRTYRETTFQYRRQVGLVAAAYVLVTALEAAGLGFGVIALLQGPRSQTKLDSLWRAGLAITLVALSSVLRYWTESRLLKLQMTVERQHRKSLTRAISHGSWNDASRLTSGEIISAMNFFPSILSSGFKSHVAVMMAGIGLIPLISYALFLNAMAVLVLIVSGLVAFLSTQRVTRWAVRVEAQAKANASVMAEQSSALLSGLKAMYVSNRRNEWQQDINEVVDETISIRQAQSRVPLLNRMLVELGSLAVAAALLLWLILSASSTDSTVLLLALLFRAAPRIQSLLQSRSQARINSVWLEDWSRILRDLPLDRDYRHADPTPKPQEISLLGVRVWANGDRRFSVAGSRVKIERGSFNLVQGPSGSGKTTLIDGLVNLARVECDEMWIDGKQSSFAPISSLLKFAYISQQAGFGAGSIRDSLGGKRGTHSETLIFSALHFAEMYEFIASLPDGLETRITSFWSGLSGGQRQRLALARALLEEPEGLVLDEALSGVEPAMEERILKRLLIWVEQKSGLVFYISHRPILGITPHSIIKVDGGIFNQETVD